ncbi:hypothetical protein T12_4737 [Trichinella patagoniensis]|uniref:Uncharacterized protein n=1 Tax=Trichinella patagoniensis TaxID=990121 RepID=A0A0V1A1X2_9BILA|nr:hypothetical protein T12_4737 [Trichinella patagoniensis]
MSHAGFRRLRTSVNTPMCKQVYTTLWWLQSTPTALASLSCIETAPVSVNETPEARKTDNTTRKQYEVYSRRGPSQSTMIDRSQRTPPGQRPKLRTAGTSGETPQSAIKSQ